MAASRHGDGYASPFDVDDAPAYIDPNTVLESESRALSRQRRHEAAEHAHDEAVGRRVRQETRRRRYEDRPQTRPHPQPRPRPRSAHADSPGTADGGRAKDTAAKRMLAAALVLLVVSAFAGSLGSVFLAAAVVLFAVATVTRRGGGALTGRWRTVAIIGIAFMTMGIAITVVGTLILAFL